MERKMADEKQVEEKDEKELEKHDEKTEEHDLLSSLAWAFIFIWAGLVFLASNLGWFARLGLQVDTSWIFRSVEDLRGFGVWNLVLIGAGVIVLIEALLRLALPVYRRRVVASIVGAIIFLGLGFGGWMNWQFIWPVVLIGIGISVLLSGLGRKK
jgi:hypothetical protein